MRLDFLYNVTNLSSLGEEINKLPFLINQVKNYRMVNKIVFLIIQLLICLKRKRILNEDMHKQRESCAGHQQTLIIILRHESPC